MVPPLSATPRASACEGGLMEHAKDFPLLLVTGLSGAGKSTALDVFEDLGFFKVDGLPASLAPQLAALFLAQGDRYHKGLVLGLAIRHGAVSGEEYGDWQKALDDIRKLGMDPQIIFVEARTEVLVQRYATTRRPHPLEGAERGLEQAILLERERLAPLRDKAALVLDTSIYSIHDLRRTIQVKWASMQTQATGMRVHVISFGFKFAPPTEADLVFDLRFLPNPFFLEELRGLTGQDQTVADYVLGNAQGTTFLTKLLEFLHYLLPLYQEEGRYRLTLACGCTGGMHRSVAVAEQVYASLKNAGYAVSLEHRHMHRG